MTAPYIDVYHSSFDNRGIVLHGCPIFFKTLTTFPRCVREAYEHSAAINDTTESFQDFDKKHLVAIYDNRATFLGFFKLKWKAELKAASLCFFLHPNVPYRNLSALVQAASYVIYSIHYLAFGSAYRSYNDLASKWLAKEIRKIAPVNIVEHEIYPKYIVSYWEISLSDIKRLLTGQTFVRCWFNVDEDTDEISINVGQGEDLTQLIYKHCDDILRVSKRHLEQHVTKPEDAFMMSMELNTVTHQFRDDFFICYRDLKHENTLHQPKHL